MEKVTEKNVWESIDRIVVGLGNPGTEYTGTRHNLGFRVLDAFLKSLKVKKQFEPVGKSRVQRVIVGKLNVLLARPSTFMNLSGTAVLSLLEKTGLGLSELLVVHDEMDISVGRAKMRVGGGAAGHNGVRDIMDRCGDSFTRLKIGIGTPPINENDESESGIDWVLGLIGPDDEEIYINLMPGIAEGIRKWIVDGPNRTMTCFNAEMKGQDIEVPGDEKTVADTTMDKSGTNDGEPDG